MPRDSTHSSTEQADRRHPGHTSASPHTAPERHGLELDYSWTVADLIIDTSTDDHPVTVTLRHTGVNVGESATVGSPAPPLTGRPGSREVGLSHMKRELVDRYRGRWVAVDEDGDVVADASELDELLTACKGKGFGADVVVHRVPEADAPLFVGLD